MVAANYEAANTSRKTDTATETALALTSSSNPNSGYSHPAKKKETHGAMGVDFGHGHGVSRKILLPSFLVFWPYNPTLAMRGAGASDFGYVGK